MNQAQVEQQQQRMLQNYMLPNDRQIDDNESFCAPKCFNMEKDQMETFHQKVLQSIEDDKSAFKNKTRDMNFPSYNTGTDYNSLYDKTLNENYGIMDDMKKLIYELTNYQICILITNEKIEDNERRIAQIQSENLENTSFKKPKYRRKNNELNKKHKCPYKNCEKYYGSDVSLNLHIKIKHNGGSKTQRQIYGKRVLENKRLDFSLDLYPGYLNVNLVYNNQALQTQMRNSQLSRSSGNNVGDGYNEDSEQNEESYYQQ